MKAIFAVTALAAAISGQALAADTETTTTFTGAMDARVVYNMAESTEGTTVLDSSYDVDLVDEDDFLYGISMEVAVINGPFSGSVGIESDEDTTATVTIGDLVVTDGKLSFGQVGGLMATDEYIDEQFGMVDGDDKEDGIGFRYAVAEGITVQLGSDESSTDDGDDTNDFTGVIASAQYMGASGPLAYVVEGQTMSSAAISENDLDAGTFIGAALTYSADMMTVMAAVNVSNLDLDTGVPTDTSDTDYVIEANTTVAGATLTAAYIEPSTENTVDDEKMFAGVSYALDAITLSAGYELTTLESMGDEVTAGLGYTAGMMSYSADVTLSNFDADEADDMMIELNATYAADSGVEYYADYAMKGDAVSNVMVGGRYSF